MPSHKLYESFLNSNIRRSWFSGNVPVLVTSMVFANSSKEHIFSNILVLEVVPVQAPVDDIFEGAQATLIGQKKNAFILGARTAINFSSTDDSFFILSIPGIGFPNMGMHWANDASLIITEIKLIQVSLIGSWKIIQLV